MLYLLEKTRPYTSMFSHFILILTSNASVNVWRGHRSTFRSPFVRLFVHHYFTLPLGPVRLAFTELHKSFVSHFAFCSMQKNASNGRRIYETIVRLVRRLSCSSTLFHRRKNAYVSHSSGIFFRTSTCNRTPNIRYCVRRSFRTMTWGGVSPDVDGRISHVALTLNTKIRHRMVLNII